MNDKYPLHHPGDKSLIASNLISNPIKYILHDSVWDYWSGTIYVFGIFDSLDDLWNYVLEFNKKSDELKRDPKMIEAIEKLKSGVMSDEERESIETWIFDTIKAANLVSNNDYDDFRLHSFDITKMKENMSKYVFEFDGTPKCIFVDSEG